MRCLTPCLTTLALYIYMYICGVLSPPMVLPANKSWTAYMWDTDSDSVLETTSEWSVWEFPFRFRLSDPRTLSVHMQILMECRKLKAHILPPPTTPYHNLPPATTHPLYTHRICWYWRRFISFYTPKQFRTMISPLYFGKNA